MKRRLSFRYCLPIVLGHLHDVNWESNDVRLCTMYRPQVRSMRMTLYAIWHRLILALQSIRQIPYFGNATVTRTHTTNVARAKPPTKSVSIYLPLSFSLGTIRTVFVLQIKQHAMRTNRHTHTIRSILSVSRFSLHLLAQKSHTFDCCWMYHVPRFNCKNERTFPSNCFYRTQDGIFVLIENQWTHDRQIQLTSMAFVRSVQMPKNVAWKSRERERKKIEQNNFARKDLHGVLIGCSIALFSTAHQ